MMHKQYQSGYLEWVEDRLSVTLGEIRHCLRIIHASLITGHEELTNYLALLCSTAPRLSMLDLITWSTAMRISVKKRVTYLKDDVLWPGLGLWHLPMAAHWWISRARWHWHATRWQKRRSWWKQRLERIRGFRMRISWSWHRDRDKEIMLESLFIKGFPSTNASHLE